MISFLFFEETPGSQRTLASSTPGGASTATTEMNTPFRDQLNITPISDETRPSKKELQQQFYQLPKPKNDFELTEIGDEDDEEGGLREVFLSLTKIGELTILLGIERIIKIMFWVQQKINYIEGGFFVGLFL